MGFERFNLGEQDLSRYDRREDELETPEIVEVRKRERAFNEKRGFQDLLRAKMVMEDLLVCSGFLKSDSIPDYVQQTIDDPRRYAVRNLGLSSTKPEEISEADLQTALQRFLDRKRKEEVLVIDGYLDVITRYEVKAESQALSQLKTRLQDCKRAISDNDWKEFGRQALGAQAYVAGLKDLLDISCGMARENDATRKVVGASKAI